MGDVSRLFLDSFGTGFVGREDIDEEEGTDLTASVVGLSSLAGEVALALLWRFDLDSKATPSHNTLSGSSSEFISSVTVSTSIGPLPLRGDTDELRLSWMEAELGVTTAGSCVMVVVVVGVVVVDCS